ncbi:glycerol-3-phosphate acyltransferase [Patescibacteria group bacterium]
MEIFGIEIFGLEILLICAISYFIGSIPFGVIVGRYKGIDITKLGSGNIGGTNILRNLGWKWGIFVIACDVLLKGALPPIIVMYFIKEPEWLGWLAFLCAAIGGFFSIFLRFPILFMKKYCMGRWHGGKGVALVAGGLLAFWGWETLVGLFVLWLFVLFFFAKGKVSIASMTLAVIVFIIGTIFFLMIPAFIVTGFVLLVISAVVWKKHEDNRKRLANGQEGSIGFIERFWIDPKGFALQKAQQLVVRAQEIILKFQNGKKLGKPGS